MFHEHFKSKMHNRTENNELFDPVADFIKRHVGVVLHEWIISVEKKETAANSFSCVFLRTDSKCYLVTARHCLEGLCQSSRIMISTLYNPWPGEIITFDSKDYVNFGMSKDKRIDICYLELEEQTAKSLKVNFFERHNCTSRVSDPQTRICLIGFPEQFHQKQDVFGTSNRSKYNLSTERFVLWTNLSNRLPSEIGISDFKPNLKFDVFIEYDPGMIHDVNTDITLPPIRPEGMSGCGVFGIPFVCENKIWNASDIKLIGIQSSYYEKNKLLKATKIEHLLEILR